jgi:uncharacterized membrane protein YfcA
MVAMIGLVLFVAGTMNGLAGFGFALLGTMGLAAVMEPATAVVFMIIPIFAVNLSLLRELSGEDLRTCSRRFWPLIGAALVGTVLGMALLRSIPGAPLRVGLGVLTLGFVATAQRVLTLPIYAPTGAARLGRTRHGMVGVGGISGLLFGGTNVGVQLIAYLRSFELSHGLFIGVVALVFIGLNGLRIGIAAGLGLYPSTVVFVGSVVATLPAVLGVAGGVRLRGLANERLRRFTVLGLLTLVGIRLVLGGLQVV